MPHPRYTRPEMGRVWDDEHKFGTWLDVEIAVLRAKEQLRLIPVGIARRTRAHAKFTVEAIEEREEITGHDMVAFVQIVSESLPPELRPYFHAGLTSYDVEDTGLAVQMKESMVLILQGLSDLGAVILALARAHQNTVEIGRTHGVHAEPITFGLKILNWYDEVKRHEERLSALRPDFLVGKVSGAVGTYANIDPRIEPIVCRRLGIYPARVSTQIVSRDRHSLYIFLLASISASLEKFATEIRNLHRTEIYEVQEPSRAGQRGSSAMPHKKALPNPVSAENTSSLPRLSRAFSTVALEDQALCWHERTLDNSAAERIIITDASTYTHYSLLRFARLLRNLKVYPERMLANLNLTKGIIFSEELMLALAQKGMAREEAHTLLQELSEQSWQNNLPFREVLLADPTVAGLLSAQEVDACLDYIHPLRHIGQIFARFPEQ